PRATSSSSRRGTAVERSIPASRIASTTTGCTRIAGADPADRDSTRSPPIARANAAAIWLRPAFCTQTNRRRVGVTRPSPRRAAGGGPRPPAPRGERDGSAAAVAREPGPVAAARGDFVPPGGRGNGVRARRGVREDDVGLPGRAVGVVDPDLVLHGVAAGGLVLLRDREPRLREPLAGLGDLLRREDLDAQVVEGPALPRVLDEDQLQRRLRDREVRVPGAALGGRGAEELLVEDDGGVDVVDVEGQLDATHADLQDIDA